MKPTTIVATLTAGLLTGSASAALSIDFNTNANAGTNNEAGYQSYAADHEVSASFTTQNFNTTFANQGPATVSLTPAFPGTTANTVRQMIDRGNATWIGEKNNLLRDWIGVDARTSNGGNGTWDGSTGTPTYITLTLTGLPADVYSMTSYHHDVENMNSFFTVEVSVDGGANYSAPMNGRMTNSLGTGTPAENVVPAGTAPNVAGGDPADLTSTMTYGFTADGTNDVVLRYTPLPPGDTTPVHQMFFGMNGFELDQVPEPSAGILGLVGFACLLRRRR